MSKGGGSTNTVQKADPWSGVQPYLTDLFAKTQGYVNGGGPQFYPGSTVAGQSNDTLAAQDLIRQRALSGNPLLGQAQNQTSNTLNGGFLFNPASARLLQLGNQNITNSPFLDSLKATANGQMLNSNPYVDSMFNQAAGQVGRQFSNNVLPGVASMFEGAGRYGSGAMAEHVGQATQSFGNTLDNLATQIYGGNYANERGLQQQASQSLGNLALGGAAANTSALGTFGEQFGKERALQAGLTTAAPGLAAADYQDPQALAALGGTQDQRLQDLLNSDIARFDFGQNAPGNLLGFYGNMLQGAGGLGGTSSVTQTGGGSRLGSMLGGGLMGASLLPALGPGLLGGLGGIGAGAGAFAGPLSGALGGIGLGPLGLLGGALLGAFM